MIRNWIVVKTFIYSVEHPFIMIVHVEVMTVISYILAVIATIITGLLLRLPLLPEKPIRDSWTISIIFPTAVIALGLSAMVFKLGWDGIVVGIVIGILSAFISKYLLETILPRPEEPVEGEINE